MQSNIRPHVTKHYMFSPIIKTTGILFVIAFLRRFGTIRPLIFNKILIIELTL